MLGAASAPLLEPDSPTTKKVGENGVAILATTARTRAAVQGVISSEINGRISAPNDRRLGSEKRENNRIQWNAA